MKRDLYKFSKFIAIIFAVLIILSTPLFYGTVAEILPSNNFIEFNPAVTTALPDITITPEIRDLASQLKNEPDRIYSYVREVAGSDFDQAALSVALLRAAGYPAKIVYGTVEMEKSKVDRAWVAAYINGEWKQFDPSFRIGRSYFVKGNAVDPSMVESANIPDSLPFKIIAMTNTQDYAKHNVEKAIKSGMQLKVDNNPNLTEPFNKGLNWTKRVKNADGCWGFKIDPRDTASSICVLNRTTAYNFSEEIKGLERFKNKDGSYGREEIYETTYYVLKTKYDNKSVEYIINSQNLDPKGSWNFNVEDTCFALISLNASVSTDTNITNATSKGIQWLIANMNDDYGFGYYSQDESYPLYTAYAALVFKEFGYSEEYNKTALWIINHVYPDGSWKYLRDSAYSISALAGSGYNISSSVEYLKVKGKETADPYTKALIIQALNENGVDVTKQANELYNMEKKETKSWGIITDEDKIILTSKAVDLFKGVRETECANAGLEYLANKTPKRLQGLASMAIAFKDDYVNCSYIIHELLKYQKEDGGFGEKYYESNVKDTSLAYIALVNTSYTIENETALSYILNSQKPDGSFGTVDETALAIIALKLSGNASLSETINKAADYVSSHQNSNGSWLDNRQTALCLRALLLVNDKYAANITKVESYLIQNQNADGSWDLCYQDVLTTIDVLRAFSITIATKPPGIISWSPIEPIVKDVEGARRTFNISVDQVANVSWLINGTEVQTNTSIYDTVYTNTSAAVGTWNVSAIATNPDGTDMQSWIWSVSPAPVPPSITSFSPSSPVSDVEGATRTFNITINQTVNVSWQINGSEVQANGSVTEASYTNTSAAVGTWNVSAVATNANGTDVQTWTWNVTVAPLPEPPTNLTATLNMNGSITLNWTPSTSPDVASYSIYISSNASKFNFTMPDETVSQPNLIWTDVYATLTDERYYIVRANDTAGNEETNTVRVGKFNISLETGWNLISIPLNLSKNGNASWELTHRASWSAPLPGDPLPVTPKNSITYIFRWNPAADRYEYSRHYADWGWVGSFSTLEPGHGYWAYTTQPCNLTIVGGVPVDSTTISLDTDWNMVGWYSVKETALDPDPLTADPPESITDIFRWNSTTDLYEWAMYWEGFWLSDEGVDTLEPGRGYWFNTYQHCTCTYEP
jgi:hypothetical protein